MSESVSEPVSKIIVSSLSLSEFMYEVPSNPLSEHFAKLWWEGGVRNRLNLRDWRNQMSWSKNLRYFVEFYFERTYSEYPDVLEFF